MWKHDYLTSKGLLVMFAQGVVSKTILLNIEKPGLNTHIFKIDQTVSYSKFAIS